MTVSIILVSTICFGYFHTEGGNTSKGTHFHHSKAEKMLPMNCQAFPIPPVQSALDRNLRNRRDSLIACGHVPGAGQPLPWSISGRFGPQINRATGTCLCKEPSHSLHHPAAALPFEDPCLYAGWSRRPRGQVLGGGGQWGESGGICNTFNNTCFKKTTEQCPGLDALYVFFNKLPSKS